MQGIIIIEKYSSSLSPHRCKACTSGSTITATSRKSFYVYKLLLKVCFCPIWIDNLSAELGTFSGCSGSCYIKHWRVTAAYLENYLNTDASSLPPPKRSSVAPVSFLLCIYIVLLAYKQSTGEGGRGKRDNSIFHRLIEFHLGRGLKYHLI